MITDRERSPLQALSTFLSVNAEAIKATCRHLGGESLSKSAMRVIDDVRAHQEPSRHTVQSIVQLYNELRRRLNMPSGESQTCIVSPEHEFAVQAEIAVLMDEFGYAIAELQLARSSRDVAPQLRLVR